MITMSLPDIEVWTSSTTEQMSTLWIWIGLAGIVGTLLLGPLFDRVNGMLLLAVCLLLQAIFIALAPRWRSLTAFQALTALANACWSTNFSG